MSFKSAKATPVVPAPLFHPRLSSTRSSWAALPCGAGLPCSVHSLSALSHQCSAGLSSRERNLVFPVGAGDTWIRDSRFPLEFEYQIVYPAVRRNDCTLNQSMAASVRGSTLTQSKGPCTPIHLKGSLRLLNHFPVLPHILLAGSLELI